MEANEQAVLIAICCGDNAKSLAEIVEITSLPLQNVIQTVDNLVEQNVLMSDNSLVASDIGTIVYSFSPSNKAQQAYATLQKPCAWKHGGQLTGCPNDAEYMYVEHERAVHHSLFCQEHRKFGQIVI